MSRFAVPVTWERRAPHRYQFPEELGTRRATKVGLVLVALAVIVAGEHWLADWLRAAGVDVVGDQPAYLVQAQALLHGTVHTYGLYAQDLAHHYFSAFPPGTKMSAAVFESYRGPRGVVSPFEPGLALLIAPFMAIHGQSGAFDGFFLLGMAGLVLIHRRVSGLCRLGWRGQVFLGVAFAGPAVFIAATQLYPDLLAGILLAAALVEVARAERDQLCRWPSVVIVALGAGYLPWLQIKNMVPAAFVLAAFVIVCRRQRAWRPLLVVGGVVGVLWVLLGAYNVSWYGHLSGYPESAPAWSQASLVRIVALLFDRHQGLFVQLPTAILAVLGAGSAFRRAPAATVAAAAGLAGVFILNGTYGSNPYGGVTLAGRFEWTAMPVCVAFGAFAIERWQDHGRALLRGALVVAAAWAYQCRYLITYRHTSQYFTQLSGWDPAAYPGWWPGLNHLLPQFILTQAILGRPKVGILVVLALAVGLVAVPALRFNPTPTTSHSIPIGLTTGLAAITAVALLAEPATPLPRPLSYPGAAIGSPLHATRTAAAVGPVVPLQGIIAGTYQVRATYALTGSRPATLTLYCDTTAVGGPPTNDARQDLQPGGHVTVGTITCPGFGAIAAGIRTPPRTRLQIERLTLNKLRRR